MFHSRMGQRFSTVALPLICTRPEVDETIEGTVTHPALTDRQGVMQTRRSPRRRALLIGIRYVDVEGCCELNATHDGVDKFQDLLLSAFSFFFSMRVCANGSAIWHVY